MPHHPSEETAEPGLTDKVAQTSGQSTASTHPIHDQGSQPGEEQKDKDVNIDAIKAHTGKGGPQMADEMPEALSKEEVQARVAELNK